MTVLPAVCIDILSEYLGDDLYNFWLVSKQLPMTFELTQILNLIKYRLNKLLDDLCDEINNSMQESQYPHLQSILPLSDIKDVPQQTLNISTSANDIKCDTSKQHINRKILLAKLQQDKGEITGSFVIKGVLSSFVSDDIDIFVPFGSGNHLHRYFKTCGAVVTDTSRQAVNSYSVTGANEINQVTNYTFNTGKDSKITFQIVIVNIVETKDYINGWFDLDIVKNVYNGKRLEIKTVSQIASQEINVTGMKWKTFRKMFKRLHKYQKRGFSINICNKDFLSFEEKVNLDTTQDILQSSGSDEYIKVVILATDMPRGEYDEKQIVLHLSHDVPYLEVRLYHEITRRNITGDFSDLFNMPTIDKMVNDWNLACNKGLTMETIKDRWLDLTPQEVTFYQQHLAEAVTWWLSVNQPLVRLV